MGVPAGWAGRRRCLGAYEQHPSPSPTTCRLHLTSRSAPTGASPSHGSLRQEKPPSPGRTRRTRLRTHQIGESTPGNSTSRRVRVRSEGMCQNELPPASSPSSGNSFPTEFKSGLLSAALNRALRGGRMGNLCQPETVDTRRLRREHDSAPSFREQLRQADEAEGQRLRAQRERKQAAEAQKELGNAAFKRGQYAAALEAYEACIALDKDNAAAYSNKARRTRRPRSLPPARPPDPRRQPRASANGTPAHPSRRWRCCGCSAPGTRRKPARRRWRAARIARR